MQLSLTTILTALSAGALALPTDGPMPATDTPNARNGLPYSNFDLYNHTLPLNASTPDGHATNNSDPHCDQNHLYHHNASSNATRLTPRGHHGKGDIASYSDDYCTITATPKVYLPDGECVKLGPLTGRNIGINWGSTLSLIMHGVQTFTDDACNTPGPSFETPGQGNMSPKGAGSCGPYNDTMKAKGEWRSVWMSA